LNQNLTTNASGCRIAPQHFFAAMLYAGLEWDVPRAQYLSLQLLEFENSSFVETSAVEGKTDIKIKTYPQTLCGIPIKLDDSVNEGTIELRHNGQVIHKIEGLAIPTAALGRQQC